jgi:hypothetical protein
VRELRSIHFLIIILLVSTVVTGVGIASTVTNQDQSEGYIEYSVNITGNGNSTSLNNVFVTEVVTPTDHAGFVNVTLSITSDTSNFTYSTIVNSSSFPMIFPYLSGLTNQSFSTAFQGITIMANLVNIGQIPVTYNETTYQATKYVVSLSAVDSSRTQSLSADGNIVSMPSGLVYTVQLSMNQTSSIDIMLVSTNLVLNEPSSSVNPLGVATLGGGAILAVAIATPTLFKRARARRPLNRDTPKNEFKTAHDDDVKRKNKDEKKPSYWVD